MKGHRRIHLSLLRRFGELRRSRLAESVVTRRGGQSAAKPGCIVLVAGMTRRGNPVVKKDRPGEVMHTAADYMCWHVTMLCMLSCSTHI